MREYRQPIIRIPLVRKVLGLQFSSKLVYRCKTLNHQYTVILWGEAFLFSVFLFLLRFELYLYHWSNLLLYPGSFIICFVRKADTTHCMWKTGLPWNECLYPAQSPNVSPVSCLWLSCRRSCSRTGRKTPNPPVSSWKNRLAKKQSSLSYWISKPQQFQWHFFLLTQRHDKVSYKSKVCV